MNKSSFWLNTRIKLGSLLFYQRLKYSNLFATVRGYLNYTPQEEMISKAMDYISKSGLRGDYLEFGTYEGYSLICAYFMAQRNRLKSMCFYAFDSFQGLPKIKKADQFSLWQKGKYRCSLDRFRWNLRMRHLDMNKIKIVPGFYDKVLNQATKKKLKLKKAVFVWVDCDLYHSAKHVLAFITDYIQDGTIIVFDDWYSFYGRPDKGEQRAFREWLKQHPKIRARQYHKYMWAGNSFILNLD